MRKWQVERRKRTRHLIELGGLVVKAGLVDLIGDDRAIILGALLWLAGKLKSDQGEQARALWSAKGEASVRGRIRGPTVRPIAWVRRFVGARRCMLAICAQ
ncbi:MULTISPECIES: conjugal transfer protein TraD [unclassified Bradyrhizobium]|uniref:conjugal transfer protein TraD n=1 Tax=unclassified Bradyrhizobium TaxID=2631580 RepID=UPI0028F02931|nr:MULTISPECIES: conjugal transfer protein TraD [unclassified Bradyrhizobium]